MNKLLPLLVIVGPTAVGKTDVAIRVAQKIDAEIISGDSMQVYKYMDIGTAKPSVEEMSGIPHHMIDIITPGEEFSVARFQELVEHYVKHISGQGKLPVLVGGTGLYVRAILDYYDFSPPGGDAALRTELLEQAQRHGNDYLVHKLRVVDPVAAGKIHANDTRRLVRALEVYHSTGHPISEFQYIQEEMPPKYNLVYFGLRMDREALYKKIEQRVDMMILRGLVNEVMRLVEMGYSSQNTAMQALGYKEILEYLNGRTSLEEAVQIIKRDTRRFAKRQMTWFRRDRRIKWINVENYTSPEEIADEIVAAAEGQFANT